MRKTKAIILILLAISMATVFSMVKFESKIYHIESSKQNGSSYLVSAMDENGNIRQLKSKEDITNKWIEGNVIEWAYNSNSDYIYDYQLMED